MLLLFPSNPLDKSAADDAYAEEFAVARAADLGCHLFSFEDFQAGDFKPRPAFREGEQVLYRGWMLSPEDYSKLHDGIATRGGVAVTTPVQYRLCHHLPEWYSICAEFTPSTVVVSKDADFVAAVAGKGWSKFFVKDYVKSLTTAQGSLAANAEEIGQVVSLIEKFRGTVEGGVCIREFELFEPETEERYFVLNGRAYARADAVPPLVQTIAERIDSRFYSLDTVLSRDGSLRLIELGDGQVSDRKMWPASRFVSMLIEGS